MKEWLEVIRDTQYFNLLVTNSNARETDVSFNLGARKNGEITVQYEEIYPITKGFDGAPNFIAASDAQSHATRDSHADDITPHMADPAPAQRAGNVAFIWGIEHEGRVLPYREDGFPAVVVAVGLSKHYHYGKLHRKKQHPAVKAEFLSGLWYEKRGINHRANGPSSVVYENYKEFWVDGRYQGHRWTNENAVWKHRILDTPEDEDTLGDFLSSLRGKTDTFGSRYFLDDEDEVCYMADLA